MADHDKKPVHEGRFGETWDAEVSVPAVVWTMVGVAVAMVVFFLLSWWIYGWTKDMRAEQTAAQSRPAVELENPGRRLPPGPRLQPKPEHELIEMRKEMEAHLHGYGLMNQEAGIVHIPIDAAIDLLLENELIEAAEAAVEEDAVEEESVEGETPDASITPDEAADTSVVEEAGA